MTDYELYSWAYSGTYDEWMTRYHTYLHGEGPFIMDETYYDFLQFVALSEGVLEK